MYQGMRLFLKECASVFHAPGCYLKCGSLYIILKLLELCCAIFLRLALCFIDCSCSTF